MAKANVTKLDNGGYDVEFEGGGRVILNADEADSKQAAEKVARERLAQGGRPADDREEQSQDDLRSN